MKTDRTPYRIHYGAGMQVMGFFILLIAVTGLAPSISTTPGPDINKLYAFLATLALVGLGVACFALEGKVSDWRFARHYRRWFERRYTNIDCKAIDKVMAHLAANTGYANPWDFEEAAGTIRATMNLPDPDASRNHTTYSWEVWGAYKYFTSGEGEIPPTKCPKK